MKNRIWIVVGVLLFVAGLALWQRDSISPMLLILGVAAWLIGILGKRLLLLRSAIGLFAVGLVVMFVNSTYFAPRPNMQKYELETYAKKVLLIAESLVAEGASHQAVRQVLEPRCKTQAGFEKIAIGGKTYAYKLQALYRQPTKTLDCTLRWDGQEFSVQVGDIRYP